MARLISSKDLFSEAGYKPSKPTVTFDELEIPKDIEPLRKPKKIDLENLNPDLQDRIARMQEDWKNNKELNPKGLDLPITRAASTAAEQQDLIKRNAAGEPNIFTPAPVPSGAKMVHQNAIDLPTTVPDSFLAQYGLFRPLIKKGDPVHVQIDPNATYEAPSFKGISSADLLSQAESLASGQQPQNKIYSPLDVMTAALSKIGLGNTVAPQEIKPNTMLEKLLGGIEAAGSMATGAVTGIPAAMAYGYVPKGSQPSAYEEAKKRSEAVSKFQYQPKTETGQNLMEMLGNVPKAILGTSAPLPPMLGVESQLLGRTAYERPPTINAPKIPSKYALTEPALQKPPTMPVNVAPASTLSGVGAAMVENNPFSGKLSGESVGRGELYPQIKLSKIAGDVSPEEQAIRSQILQPILKDSGQIRPGVLTGNEQTLRAEHNAASRPERTPGGEMFKRQIVNEQNALTDYAKQRIEKTGASRLLVDDAERGEALNNAFIGHYDPKTKEFEGFTGFVNKLKSEVYDQAKKAVGENPIKSTHIDSLLNDEQFKAGLGLKEGNESVARSAEKLINLAKTIGFKDPITGQKYKPNSINGFIAVKKALNEKWDHNNKNIIGQVNRAIDQDIFAAGGEDLFKKGDALHEAEKIIFESKGMDTIFGEFDPNGIKKGVDQDKIMAKLNSLDTAQWKHIYNTADDISKGILRVKGYEFKIPESVIEQANMIKSEMKGSIAREIFKAGEDKAGVWNQNSANKIMNSRQGKIRYAFE
jgi:hypothetical protein